MKKHQLFLSVVGFALICTGCAINLPFNNRLDYPAVRDAKKLSSQQKGPISITWVPASFPQRVDVQGASGFTGGGSQTRIPVGPGLSSRILEALDTSIGVSESPAKPLTITIIHAQTDFEYSAGIFNVTPAIDVAKCTLVAVFAVGGQSWTGKFSASATDPTIGGSSQTGLVEKVWDDIALQVVRSVVQHL